MCERDGCSEEIMSCFDQLSFSDKVIFTHKNYENISCAFEISGYENDMELGNIIDFRRVDFKIYYDEFDFISWINSNEERNIEL